MNVSKIQSSLERFAYGTYGELIKDAITKIRFLYNGSYGVLTDRNNLKYGKENIGKRSGMMEDGIKGMKKYKYFSDVKKNAVFTDKPCQFCGREDDCLEGVYFEKSNVESVCLACLDRKRMGVDIPNYIVYRIKNKINDKIEELKYTPPVPWIQFNDWQVCCDDYMKYIGEWEQKDFIRKSTDADGISLLKELLNEDTLKKVDDIFVLWEDISYNTVAYAFKCLICGKIIVVCQSY